MNKDTVRTYNNVFSIIFQQIWMNKCHCKSIYVYCICTVYSVRTLYFHFVFVILLTGVRHLKSGVQFAKMYACNMHAMCVKFTSNIKYKRKKM
jgi:hypothetical protein